MSAVLVFKPCVDIADEIYEIGALALERSVRTARVELTIIVIVTHNQLLQLPVLAHLAPDVFIECVKVVLKLTRVHLVLGVVCWVLVQVGKEDRL